MHLHHLKDSSFNHIIRFFTIVVLLLSPTMGMGQTDDDEKTCKEWESKLPQYSTVSFIKNTERYLLCQEDDRLSYIYDIETGRSFPAMFGGKHQLYRQVMYLGERNGEPIFHDSWNEMFGLEKFYAQIDYDPRNDWSGLCFFQESHSENKICLKEGPSKGVWISLDEIPQACELVSLFDENAFVSKGFQVRVPQEMMKSNPNVAEAIYFNARMPILNYPPSIKKHILYWISDCYAAQKGKDCLLNVTDKTSEKYIVDYLNRMFIQDELAGEELPEGDYYSSGDWYNVECILNTKDYASFVFDYSCHLGEDAGGGYSYAATFDLKNNRRLTLSDLVEKEALHVMERKGLDGGSPVALGWEGLYCFVGSCETSLAGLQRSMIPYDSIRTWLKIHPTFNPSDNSYPVKVKFEPIKQLDSEQKFPLLTQKFIKNNPVNWSVDEECAHRNDQEINDGYNRNHVSLIRDDNPLLAIKLYPKIIEEYKGCAGGEKLDDDMFYSYISLAKTYTKSKDYKKAQDLCMEILKCLHSDSIQYPVLNHHTVLASKDVMGIAPNKVVSSYSSPLWKYTTGEEYNVYIDAIRLLSEISFLQKDKKAVIGYGQRAASLLLPYLQNVMSTLTKNKKNILWQHYNGWLFSDLVKMANWSQDPYLLKSAYEAQLYGKGLLLNSEVAMIKHIMNGEDEGAKQELEAYLLEQARMEKYRREGKKEQMALSEADLNEINESLMKHVSFSNYMQLQNVSMVQVLKNLKGGEIAIEFVDVQEDNDTVLYALALQPKNVVPTITRICSVKDLRNITVDDVSNGKLHQLVWKPLAMLLNSGRTVFFAPCGMLHTLAVESAVDAKTGKRMNEQFTMYRLSSTREIVHARDPIFQRQQNAEAKGLLIGGLDYNANVQTKKKTNAEESNLSLLRGAVRMNNVRLLPATQKEIEEIAPLVSSMMTADNVVILDGKKGTETAFRMEAQHPLQMVHIATHGFFLTDRDIERLGEEHYLSKLSKEYRDIEEKGLIRSGLIFAGVNQVLKTNNPISDMDDGIITAMEIGTMDLNHVDLAVLSACRTGVGEITDDGVMGLQRGFKKAGVNTILMSLWPVDDDATHMFMTKFYEELATSHNKLRALTEAQRTLQNSAQYNAPQYWAAFILLDAME